MKKILSKRRKLSASDEIDQKNKLLHAVNGVAEILLTADEEEFESSLREAMALVARYLDIDRVYIWQNQMRNGRLQYIQQFEWLKNPQAENKTVYSKEGFPYAESIPEWEKKFSKGDCVNGPLHSLSPTEQKRLEPYGIRSILVVPVHLQNHFWGFVSFDDCHQDRTFNEDEISILRSANLMLASAFDRHETSARIREADGRAKLMLDATPLCCSLWDRQLNIIDCNKEAVNFFSLKDKQEFMDKFFELSPEYQPDMRRSKEKALEYISATFRDGKIIVDWMHQDPYGAPLPSELTLVRVKQRGEYIVAAYLRDLREHKEMMKAIEYKDSLLHTVNETAMILLRSDIDEFEYNLKRCLGMMAASVGADRMYIWKNYNRDGQQYCSQQYEWSGGAESQQGSIYTTNILCKNASRWMEVLSGGQCINDLVSNLPPIEQSQLYPQGILSILVVPVFLRDQFWGFVGFDDCHRKRVFSEEEVSILRSASLLIGNAFLRNEMTHDIRAAVEKAQEASKAKSAFLARMSHEIRTPMNVIAGVTELMLRENIPETIHEHVLNIKYASANMLSLINDILDFSKIEAGNLEIAYTEYSLTSLINNVLIIMRMKVSEKPILLTANIDCNIPNRLIGDETRLRQILLNVLDNAAKYTAAGFVSLAVTGEIKEDTVILTAEVSDSGVGIKKADMDRLFGDFMRLDGEKNKDVQGTGLGLAITASLCQAMGGNISVSSEYGVGSTFTVTIPQQIKSHNEKFAHVSDPDAKSVLLYETRPIYADSIARSLDNLGVRHTLVKNQNEFYEKLKERSYPFVFVSSVLSESAGQMIGELKLDTKLVQLVEFGEAPAIHNIRTIATPVHAASIANILDDIEENIFYNESDRKNVRFIAPSAEILVVDDLNTNLKVAKGLMLPYQMRIDICESGEEAIEYVQKKRYDIIFMDHMMPGMDGIETVRRIRSLKGESSYNGGVPIIMLTANAVSGANEMFLQNGMDDFLAKPIDVIKLHALLDKWIPAEKKEKFNKPQTKLPADANPSIKIEGVDVQAGTLMAGGTVDGYLKILAMFHTDGTDKISKIRDCVKKNDIELYTTYAHAMKSAAANIGAIEISELFKQLELAGAQENSAYIRENTERALDKLETLFENIHAIGLRNQDKPMRGNDPKFLRGELSKLKSALNSRDAGEIDSIMSTLDSIKWKPPVDEIFKEISRNVLLINYADALALIDALLVS